MDVAAEATAASHTHTPGHLQATGGDAGSALATESSVKVIQINDVAKDFIAGTIGGVAGVVVGHPFDTVKVRMQCQSASSPHRGVLGTALAIVRQEKVRGLYKGMASPIAGVGLINAMLFGVYGNILRAMKDQTDGTRPVPVAHACFAGTVSGFVNSLVSCPIELVKTRLQMQIDSGQGTQFRGPLHLSMHMLRTQGPRGLFGGMTATVLREGPSYGVYFASFEFVGQALARRKGGVGTPDELSAIELLVVGGVCGIVAWLSTYPIDVVKTRMQAQDPANPQYQGMVDCVRKSIQNEGRGVLWRGLNATVVRAFPVNGAIFAMYTLSMGYLDKYM